jgi:hypothetical protein
MLYPTVLRCSTVFQPIITVLCVYSESVPRSRATVTNMYNLMHMWHHVTNHLIISNDKDSNSENRIKLRVRDKGYLVSPVVCSFEILYHSVSVVYFVEPLQHPSYILFVHTL